ISGILSGFMFGPYSMSKHAVEAFTDSLALEMRKFDVAVSVIEPGNYRSAIVDNIFQRLEERGQSPEGSLYREEYERMLSNFQGEGYDQRYVKEPDEVSAALLDFLSNDNPKRRYMVVPNERSAEVTIRKAISELTQLNQDHTYTYSRDELVTMLDEALNALEESR
ncbi:MAG: SDR family NAD(P)-dependent oxidoreductase, partial [Gammaproteobacteria bacterium]|nr:SDR family NAD(P)-dependent oxidoreductase [Gammaproteobacteria bacterium]